MIEEINNNEKIGVFGDYDVDGATSTALLGKFFSELKRVNIPVSLREFLTFLDALQHGIADFYIESFYYLARLSLITNEKHIDKFDQVFSTVFDGIQNISQDDLIKTAKIPQESIEKHSQKFQSTKDKQEIWVNVDWGFCESDELNEYSSDLFEDCSTIEQVQKAVDDAVS